jgi:hypothetical protein
MALAALLFVFFLAVVAIALAVFPPHKLVQWMQGDKAKKK